MLTSKIVKKTPTIYQNLFLEGSWAVFGLPRKDLDRFSAPTWTKSQPTIRLKKHQANNTKTKDIRRPPGAVLEVTWNLKRPLGEGVTPMGERGFG